MARSRVQSHNTHCFLLPALNITRFAAPVEIMLTEMLFYATAKLAVIYKSWYIASDREKLESKNLLALKLVGVMAYAQWVLAYALLLKVSIRETIGVWPIGFGSFSLAWEGLDALGILASDVDDRTSTKRAGLAY